MDNYTTVAVIGAVVWSAAYYVKPGTGATINLAVWVALALSAWVQS